MKAVDGAFTPSHTVGDLPRCESHHVTQDHDFTLFFGKRRQCRADGLGLVEIDPRARIGVEHGLRRREAIRAQVIDRDVASEPQEPREDALRDRRT